ncbi:outer membrane lipoprotein carrier protein LolA [Arenimonas sp.]|uniref:outer membrane lipoprotein carrier protein LolA n=1 Tax=Arenimonas sp. TaxID=1872635 RepID=UPI0025EAAB21|nr:outer membrane lipoprotein carrier protein LolA [Arenimonas sp.]
MSRFLVLLLVLALGAPAVLASAGTSDGVAARLDQPAVLRGRFEQDNQLQGFRHPLRSRGEFLLVRGRGLAWDTREPFASGTVIGARGIVASTPEGGERVLARADDPAQALLMALVGADLEALARSFDTHETLLDDGRWRLRLLPREPGLRNVFASVELAGDRHVREVRIEETGGDTTELRFTALETSPPPTDAELARLD